MKNDKLEAFIEKLKERPEVPVKLPLVLVDGLFRLMASGIKEYQ